MVCNMMIRTITMLMWAMIMMRMPKIEESFFARSVYHKFLLRSDNLVIFRFLLFQIEKYYRLKKKQICFLQRSSRQRVGRAQENPALVGDKVRIYFSISLIWRFWTKNSRQENWNNEQQTTSNYKQKTSSRTNGKWSPFVFSKACFNLSKCPIALWSF